MTAADIGLLLSALSGAVLLGASVLGIRAFAPRIRLAADPAARLLAAAIVVGFLAAGLNTAYWQLFARPLVAAGVLEHADTRLVGMFLDVGIHQAMSGVMGGSLFGRLLAACAIAVMLTAVYVVLLERSFSLVSELPARVLGWMGARADLVRGDETAASRTAAAAGVGAIAGGAHGIARGGAPRPPGPRRAPDRPEQHRSGRGRLRTCGRQSTET